MQKGSLDKSRNLEAEDITGAMWDSWGRGDLDVLASMGVNTPLDDVPAVLHGKMGL